MEETNLKVKYKALASRLKNDREVAYKKLQEEKDKQRVEKKQQRTEKRKQQQTEKRKQQNENLAKFNTKEAATDKARNISTSRKTYSTNSKAKRNVDHLDKDLKMKLRETQDHQLTLQKYVKRNTAEAGERSDKEKISNDTQSAVVKKAAVSKKKPTKSSEAKRKYEREKKRRQRAKISPEDLIKRRAKDLENKRKKKQEGKIKTVKDMTPRQKRQQRKKWKQYTKRYREKKVADAKREAFLQSNTPPLSPEADGQLPQAKSSRTSGRKKVKRQRSKTYRELTTVKFHLKKMTSKYEKYKKRCQRLVARSKGSPSPRKKVEQLIQGRNVGAVIKKELLFAEVVKDQLRRNKNNKSENVRRSIGILFEGPYLAKYKMIIQHQDVLSYKLLRKNQLSKGAQFGRKKYSTLATKTAASVRQFFEEDINSRMCPGKKDTKTKNKVRKQKRLLLDTLVGLHRKYNETHVPKLSYNTFKRLKPFWVLQPKMSDRETCACKKHANMQFLVAKLPQHELFNVKKPDDLFPLVCCDSKNKDCLLRKCKVCKSKTINAVLTNEKEKERVKYYEWQTNSEDRNIKGNVKIVKFTEKVLCECTVLELIDKLNSALPEFLIHCYNIGHQYHEMKNQRQTLKPNEVQVQVDFSENYVLKLNEEVQSMHFGASQRQVSLHTGVMYCVPNEVDTNLKYMSFCTVSSNLDHSASAIWAHLKPIIELMKTDFLLVDTLHFISDGPSAQYKNRFNLFLIAHYLPKLFPSLQAVSWNYSESSHGKGPMDGVGGVLKRTADNLIKLGRDIATVEAFVQQLKVACPGVHIVEISSSQIEKMKEEIPQDVQKIPRIMKLHQVAWSVQSPNCLQLRELSCAKCSPKEVCAHHALGKGVIKYLQPMNKVQAETEQLAPVMANMNNDLVKDVVEVHIGEYVAVIYDNIWYPGEVIAVQDEQATIRFMKRSGEKYFQWPIKKDVQTIDISGILCVIPNPPTSRRKRGTGVNRLFTIHDCEHIDMLAQLTKVFYGSETDVTNSTSLYIPFGTTAGMEHHFRVRIIEEPQEHHRFRYDTEKGSHGSLLGCNSTSKNNKTSPKIEVSGYDGEVEVKVSLRLSSNPEKLHVHLLDGNNCTDGIYKIKQRVKISGTVIEFPGIHIKHVGKREAEATVRRRYPIGSNDSSQQCQVEKAVKEMCSNLNEVILFFEVTTLNPCLQVYANCYSKPVKNSKGRSTNKLKIRRIDRYAASATGLEEMFLLCDKVDKDDIAVRFYDKQGWQADAKFNPTDVHYQVAIVFKIPPYKEQILDKQVNVFFHLYRPSNENDRSEEMEFLFKPTEDDGMKRKKAKPNPFTGFECLGSSNVNRQNLSDAAANSGSIFNEPVMNTPEVIEYAVKNNLFSDSLMNIKSVKDIENFLQHNPNESPMYSVPETKPPALPNDSFSDFSTYIEPSVNSGISDFFNPIPPLFEGTDLVTDSPPVQDTEVSSSDSSPAKPALVSRGTAVERQEKHTDYPSKSKTVVSRDLTTDSAKIEKTESSSKVIPNKEMGMPDYELAYRLAVQTSLALQDYAKTGDIRLLLMTMRHLVAIQDENGDNAIHMSVIHSQKEPLQHLIDVAKNINLDPINMANKLTQTPLHLAIYTNQSELVSNLLLSGARCEVLDRQGNNPYHIVAQHGYIETLKILSSHCDRSLLNALNYDGLSPLHLAVQSNHLEFVKELCHIKANMNVHDGTTGSTPLQLAVEKQHLEIIKYLLENTDVDVDSQNFMGNTALHLACMANNETIVELLLKAGADPHIESTEPLIQAESSSSSSSSDEDDRVAKDEFQGCRPMDLIQSNERIKQLIQGQELPKSEVIFKKTVQEEASTIDSLASKDSCISEEEEMFERKHVTEEKSMPDSGIGLSGSLTTGTVIDDVTKDELSKLLDLPEGQNWRTLSSYLQIDYLNCYAEKQKSPTAFLLDFIENLEELQNVLEAMERMDAVSVLKNYRLNRDSRTLSSCDVGSLTNKMSKFNLHK